MVGIFLIFFATTLVFCVTLLLMASMLLNIRITDVIPKVPKKVLPMENSPEDFDEPTPEQLIDWMKNQNVDREIELKPLE